MRNIVALAAALSLPLTAHADDRLWDTPEQAARNCVSDCREVFLPCVFNHVEELWHTCYNPARPPHPQGPDVERIMCDLQVSNHAALCSSAVMGCSLECTVEFLHPAPLQ